MKKSKGIAIILLMGFFSLYGMMEYNPPSGPVESGRWVRFFCTLNDKKSDVYFLALTGYFQASMRIELLNGDEGKNTYVVDMSNNPQYDKEIIRKMFNKVGFIQVLFPEEKIDELAHLHADDTDSGSSDIFNCPDSDDAHDIVISRGNTSEQE
jgi:hypothetical protein